MSKHSNYERRERDFYPTPYTAVLPLLPHLEASTEFIEPCAGDGRLINHLERHGHKCLWAGDIEPQAGGIFKHDCLMMDSKLPPAHAVITNPPWERSVLHQIISRFSVMAPTWLLFDSSWMFTKQARDYLEYCHTIITVGRVLWIEGTKSPGKEDCCWYGFGRQKTDTKFIGKRS